MFESALQCPHFCIMLSPVKFQNHGQRHASRPGGGVELIATGVAHAERLLESALRSVSEPDLSNDASSLEKSMVDSVSEAEHVVGELKPATCSGFIAIPSISLIAIPANCSGLSGIACGSFASRISLQASQ